VVDLHVADQVGRRALAFDHRLRER
jgi:hypothetical protein